MIAGRRRNSPQNLIGGLGKRDIRHAWLHPLLRVCGWQVSLLHQIIFVWPPES